MTVGQIEEARRITEIDDLYDVSAVGIPAYSTATVTARTFTINALRSANPGVTAAVTTHDDAPAMDDAEVASDVQREGEGDGQQLPPDGPSDTKADSEPGHEADARSRVLTLLSIGAPQNVTARTPGSRE